MFVVLLCWCRSRSRGDSGEEGAQAGACSPLDVQTEDGSLSSRAVVAGGRGRMGSSEGRGKESPALSAAHLVVTRVGC